MAGGIERVRRPMFKDSPSLFTANSPQSQATRRSVSAGDKAIGAGRPWSVVRLFRRFRGNVRPLLAVLDFACPLDRLHHQVRFVRAQHNLQLYHTTRKQTPSYGSCLGRGPLVGHLGVSEAATDPLQLCVCRIERHLQQLRFIAWGCHSTECSDFCIGELAGSQCSVNGGQGGQRSRYAYPFPCSSQVEPNSPRQPMSTRNSALFAPATLFVEPTNTREQPMCGRIQPRRQLRNLLPQILANARVDTVQKYSQSDKR